MEGTLQALEEGVAEKSLDRKASAGREVRKTFLRLGKFVLVLAGIWIVLYGVYAALPYTRPGVDLIYDAKVGDARGRQLFVTNRPNRVLIFGNSLVLSGFKPDMFDKLSVGQAESFNMGIPDELWFTGALRDLLANGQRPTHVLISIPWREDGNKKRTLFNLIPDDGKFLSEVFPFRKMPRNLVLFSLLARSHGGMGAFYRYARAGVEQMQADRGYYFIEGQSHYANDELPPDYTLEEDSPDKPYVRAVPSGGEEFAQLRAWSEQYHFDVYVVPIYLREHAASVPPPSNVDTLKAIAPYPNVHLLGPDYFRFPNKLFSDNLHANPRGAEAYTRAIYDLISPYFKKDDSAARH